ncbi:MAG: beta-ketoacyl-[acyl-carrier-protein] synthase family protein [Candidatus Omnitrophica bacterium]|nr:beta-ketoacyl-[acyl-carrier-protein] synthase family protein [Candidatus Omnitrophota bacterium]
MRKRVVITGAGALTATGEGAEALWQAVVRGDSGIGRVSLDGNGAAAAGGLAAARVPDFDAERFVSQKKTLKVMARDIQFAVAGAALAAKDARLGPGLDPERCGVIVGAGVLNHEIEELAVSIGNSLDGAGRLDLRRFGEEGIPSLFPLWLLKYLPNMPACHISILLNFQGMNNTITTGATSGLQAIGEAFRILERGDADLLLAGGAESKVNPVGLSEYQVLGVLSESASENPKAAYRPFDAGADGFVVGEGAGFLVLEELEHARKRGASIIAEVVGFGSSSDTGLGEAMQAALGEAGIRPDRLGYLQASGIGLPEEDLREILAIQGIFNGAGRRLVVSASKPVTGFTGFASGALDVIVSSYALKNQIIPPTLNFKRPRVPLGFRLLAEPKAGDIRFAMTNACGLNGHSASLITKAWRDTR